MEGMEGTWEDSCELLDFGVIVKGGLGLPGREGVVSLRRSTPKGANTRKFLGVMVRAGARGVDSPVGVETL